MSTLYILAGPNGAGKFTAAKTLLPEVFHCDNFINADGIAAQLDPSHPDSVALKTGRMMPEQVDEALKKRQTFAIETTMATRSYLGQVQKAHLMA